MRPVNLGTVAVGGDNPPYIVAEVGSNHNGDMDLCLQADRRRRRGGRRRGQVPVVE